MSARRREAADRRRRRRRRSLLALAALVASGCAAPPPAPSTEPAPLTEASVAAAAETLRTEDAAQTSFALTEDGLDAQAWTWQWVERVEWETPPVGTPEGDAALARKSSGAVIRYPVSHVVRERTLVGPKPLHVPFSRILSARVHGRLLQSSVELRLDGETEPIEIEVSSDASAQRIADAIEVLVRARDTREPR